MKIVLSRNSVSVPCDATFSTLVKLLFDNQVIPTFYSAQLTGLRSMLESSVATMRNKMAGHGQGEQAAIIPPEYARYTLCSAANAMLFLAGHVK
jgi:hypothetical protein